MLIKLVLSGALAAFVALPFTTPEPAPPQSKPFGGPADVAFAGKVWKAMEGYQDWKLTTVVYKGQSPHGKWLRLFSSWVTVDGKHYPIIVKENYGGRGVTKEGVEKDSKKWLKAVTIMLQREAGYDRDNDNWYWVKYSPTGSIEKNPMGMQLAGRVAKGMNQGCISCHSQAAGKDFLYSND